MIKEGHTINLSEKDVLRLPYLGPPTRRLYIIYRKNEEEIKELFVQREDAFTIDLVNAINQLRNHEIYEVRYLCGVDGFIRIYIDEEKLAGEFFCKTRNSLVDFKRKIGL